VTGASLTVVRSVYRGVPIALAAAAGSGVVAVLVARGSSTVAAGAVFALLLGALIARLPGLVFAVCLLALCYSPEYLGSAAGVFAHPQLQKGLVYFAVLAIALQRGMRLRFLIVPGAYVVLAVLSELNGQLTAGLTLTQILSSFVTLTVGWTALAIRWDYKRDVVYLKVLSFLPVACLLVGLLMQAAHLHSFLATELGSATRLQGASGPAQLALTSFIGCVTASICYRMTRWKFAPTLVVANAVILGLTVSRGAAIALAIALTWPALRFAFGSGQDKRWLPQPWLRIALLAIGTAAAAALLVPRLLARGAANQTYIPGAGFVHDSTTGRAEAWHEFYVIARKSPLFGHGLGSGPITKITQQGFLAQHNEYLRLFLEGGYIGGGLVLAAIIIVIGTCIARAPRRIRVDLFALAIGFAVLSYTDNTLTSVNLQVPFCLVFGIAASASMRRPTAPIRPSTVPRPVRVGPTTSLERPPQAVG
jgi:teichuronic acid biosynthesis protein TuaE